jgi:hypothetical protein
MIAAQELLHEIGPIELVTELRSRTQLEAADHIDECVTLRRAGEIAAFGDNQPRAAEFEPVDLFARGQVHVIDPASLPATSN